MQHFTGAAFSAEGGAGDVLEPKRLYERTGLMSALWRLIAVDPTMLDPAMLKRLQGIARQIVAHEADFVGDDFTSEQKHALFWKLCELSGGHNANVFARLLQVEREMAAVRDGDPALPTYTDIDGNEITTFAGRKITLQHAKRLIREARRRLTVWVRRS